MKKNIRKLVAAALVTFQVVLTAAVGFVPASAEAGTGGRKRSYHAYQADAPITLDGKVSEGEAWDNLPWSEDVVKYEDTNKVFQTYYASFKSMWYKNGDTAHLYFLINFNDYVHNAYDANNVHFNLGIDESGTATGGFTPEKWTDGDVVATEDSDTTGAFEASKSGVIQQSNAGKGGNGTSAFRFCIQRTEDDPQVTIEVEYTFRTPSKAEAGKKLGFELMTMHGYWAKSDWNDNAWRGKAENFGALYLEAASASTRKAVTAADDFLIVSSADVTDGASFTLPAADPHSASQLVAWKDAEGKLYKPGAVVNQLDRNLSLQAVTVDFRTLAEAKIRVLDPTGLSFYSEFDKADFDALGSAVTATGTLLLPTDLLGESALTFETFAGKTEGTDYLNIRNGGWLNAETAEADGVYRYRGSIVEIKTENYDRNFSAVGYYTVTYADGSTATFYGGYSAENACSVKQVAQKALDAAKENADLYSAEELAVFNSYVK